MYLRNLRYQPYTLYVNNTIGNDDNDGSSANCAFLSVQAAIDHICSSQDHGNFAQPTILLADTNVVYNSFILKRHVGALCWDGPSAYTYPRIVGDAGTNTAVKISTVDAAVTGVKCGSWILENLQIKSASNYGIVCDADSHIYNVGCDFGACHLGHIASLWGGFFEHLSGTFTISAGGFCHFVVTWGGRLMAQNNTCVLSNMPLFHGGWFGYGSAHGMCNYSQLNFSGSCVPTNGVNSDGTAYLAPTPTGWP